MTRRVAAVLCLALLGACSSGGGSAVSGGGGAPTPPAPTPPTPAPPAPSPPSVTIGSAAAGSLAGSAPVLATGASPNLATPTVGASFPLFHSVMLNQDTTASAQAAMAGSVTVQNVFPDGSVQLRLQVPSLGIDLNNLSLNNAVTQPDGGIGGVNLVKLNYAILGNWNFRPAGSTRFYQGSGVGGYQTPGAGMPATGSATYSATGAVRGVAFTSTNNAGEIGHAALTGDTNVTVNFTSGAVSGTLSNMRAGGAAFNTVVLTGNVSGTGVSGTTAVPGEGLAFTPGNYAQSPAASGGFSGAFYGPAANEIGGVWTLNDAAHSKAALGTFGGAKP